MADFVEEYFPSFFSTGNYAKQAIAFSNLHQRVIELNTTSFNQSSLQMRLISECNEAVFNQLKDLQKLDKNMGLSLIGGFASSLVSFLPVLGSFLSLMSTGFYFYCIYAFCERNHTNDKYHATLNNLAQVLTWVLKEIKTETQLESLLNMHQEIRTMIRLMASLTTKDQLTTIVNNIAIMKYINGIAVDAEKEHIEEKFGRALDPDQTLIYLSIYGYEKGRPADILKGLYYTICQGTTWAYGFISEKIKQNTAASGGEQERPQRY